MGNKYIDSDGKLKAAISDLDWKTGDPPEDYEWNTAFLLLTDRSQPFVEFAIWTGIHFISLDDLGLCGPCKCAEAWTVIGGPIESGRISAG